MCDRYVLGLRSISIEGRKRVVEHSLLIEFCTDLARGSVVRVKREKSFTLLPRGPDCRAKCNAEKLRYVTCGNTQLLQVI